MTSEHGVPSEQRHAESQQPESQHAMVERPESQHVGAETAVDGGATTLLPTIPRRPDMDATALIAMPVDNDATTRIAMPVNLDAGGAGQVFRSPRSAPASQAIPLEIKVEFADRPEREARHRKTTARHGQRGGKDGEAATRTADRTSGDGEPKKTILPGGELVIPLRPVRTEEGYRSVYSDLTRPTIWTMLRTVSRACGETMITFGLIVLLFAAYEVWGVGAAVSAHQNDLTNQLARDWGNNPAVPEPSASASTAPVEGAAIAKLYIPRIQATPWVVVEGVTAADIRYAPGHYPTTVMPGEVGNFSVAGHRTLTIFWNLDRIQAGDQMVVETKDTWFIYTATTHETVQPNNMAVIAAVPDKPGATAVAAMITLTTCTPKGTHDKRLIVHGMLAGQQPHDAGPPAGVAA